VDPRRLLDWMPDLAPLDGHCRFGDCRHDAEPGCALQAAVAAGQVEAGRLAFYRELAAECSR
jgi:ribosome biogenesis GTPase